MPNVTGTEYRRAYYPYLAALTDLVQGAPIGTTSFDDRNFTGMQPWQVYGGQRVAGIAPLEQQAINQLGPGGYMNQIGQALGFGTGQIGNPNLQGMIDASLQDVQRNLYEGQLPAQARAAAGAGAFGGSAHALNAGLLERGAADRAASISSQLRFNDYKNAINQGLVFENQYMNQLGAYGGLQRDVNQQQLAAAEQRFNEQQMAPWVPIQMFGSALGLGASPTPQQSGGLSPLQQLLLAGGSKALSGGIGYGLNSLFRPQTESTTNTWTGGSINPSANYGAAGAGGYSGIGSGIGGAAGAAIGNAILPGVGGLVGAGLGSAAGGYFGGLFG